ncbi:hypothetical protein CGQ47_04000 [Listeria monocytogenes]|nr:hypothetical protein [Listeria monocytogenes]EAF1311682.1 hypothetical protein [Listeria monocytogenes]
MEMIAYHGTSKELLPKIETQGLREGKSTGDLGNGIYAFIGKKEAAINFINKFTKNKGLVELNLSFEEDEFVDFDDPYFENMFNDSKEAFLDSAIKKLIRSKSTRLCVDGIIIKSMLDNYPEFKDIKLVAKTTYTPSEKEYIGKKQLISNFRNGKEVCLFQRNVIESYKVEVI